MTTKLTAVRWGDGRRADSDFAREQILDAAWRCYNANTVYKTSMEDIAGEAKVSRTTIYRYFQNRDEVLTGLIVRALHEIIDAVRERIADIPCFAEFLVEALASVVEGVIGSPVLSTLLHEESAVLRRIYIGSDDVFAITSRYLQPRFDAAKEAGTLREGVEFEQFMYWCSHVSAAYVRKLPPSRVSASEWRRMLWQFLVPAIVCDSAIPKPTPSTVAPHVSSD